jgi:hypothetical protein
MIKVMIMALCLSSNEATVVSKSVITEIGPGDGKSKGFNYKKHYKKLYLMLMSTTTKMHTTQQE